MKRKKKKCCLSHVTYVWSQVYGVVLVGVFFWGGDVKVNAGYAFRLVKNALDLAVMETLFGFVFKEKVLLGALCCLFRCCSSSCKCFFLFLTLWDL